MEIHYTSERNVQILLALLKFHGIKKIVASPGTTNMCINASVQNDPYFEAYSSVDERSAAYIACGLAAESGEPVVLSCTGATASRNYVPGLTEAFYRQLPILAVTVCRALYEVGNNRDQQIDRSRQMRDMVKESVVVDVVKDATDEWQYGLAINKAIIALKRHGGGPAHINLVTTYSKDFSVKELPAVHGISYHEGLGTMPSLESFKKIAVLVGVHNPWSKQLQEDVDKFCETYNAVVLKYHACNYKGKYGVNHSIMKMMKDYKSPNYDADLVIYIGSIARYQSMHSYSGEMWRVNPDGLVRDPERILTRVFAMSEEDFFHYYSSKGKSNGKGSIYAKAWQEEYESIEAQIPELPLSNVWVAHTTIGKIPKGSSLHIAGSNTARAWNMFPMSTTIDGFSNDGTMGIDGQVSALVGESLANPKRLHFGVCGDLTFFYDMNSIGNRHIKGNLRLIVINNGMGAEFRLYSHPSYFLGEEGKPYVAAAGHFGNKSHQLLRHYAEDLGFEYLTASTKEEYLKVVERFTVPEITDRPMLLEVFTNEKDESDALYAMNHIAGNASGIATKMAKKAIKNVLGDDGISTVKNLLRKK